jgi:hypothetical protein
MTGPCHEIETEPLTERHTRAGGWPRIKRPPGLQFSLGDPLHRHAHPAVLGELDGLPIRLTWAIHHRTEVDAPMAALPCFHASSSRGCHATASKSPREGTILLKEAMRRSCSTIGWRRTGSGAATRSCQPLPSRK